jgi:hypothetical protein
VYAVYGGSGRTMDYYLWSRDDQYMRTKLVERAMLVLDIL